MTRSLAAGTGIAILPVSVVTAACYLRALPGFVLIFVAGCVFVAVAVWGLLLIRGQRTLTRQSGRPAAVPCAPQARALPAPPQVAVQVINIIDPKAFPALLDSHPVIRALPPAEESW